MKTKETETEEEWGKVAEFRKFEAEDIDYGDEHEVEVYGIGIQQGKKIVLKEEIEFLENELYHLKNQPEEIKITIRNITKEIKDLKAKLQEVGK